MADLPPIGYHSTLSAMASGDFPPFEGYERIGERLEAWVGDDEAAYRALARVPWIVTEKIHGANFCLVTDGAVLRCAKRKAYLDPDEDFFGHRAVLDRNAGAILDLGAQVRKDHPGVAWVFVYGELFGGAYPHPDVPPDPSVQPVQTGVHYAPTIELCAFDLGVLRDGYGETRRYIDYDEAAERLRAAGLLHAEPLFRGSYEEAIAYPLGFESTIPAALGLPPLPPGNKAEGVVVKPVREAVLPQGKGAIRPVVKKKIAEFAEDERFHRAEKWAVPLQNFAAALEILKVEVSARVTENRLNAAVSKVGRAWDVTRHEQVAELIVQDLRTELRERHGDHLRALTTTEAAELSRFIEGEARALVDLYLTR
jgi:Rnl2 family RNA ligase